MNSPPNNPPPTATKTSALAITGFVFAALSLYPCLGIATGLLMPSFCGNPMPGFLFLFCSVFAIGFSMAALIAIKRSSGKLVGKGLVVGTLVIIGLLLVLMLVDALCGPFGERRSKNDNDTARVQSMVQCLCVASKGYYNEYGHWPQPRTSGDLVLIYNGLIDPRTDKSVSNTRPDLLEQNPQRSQFMEFKPRDVMRRGKSQAELTLYDPWGTPYAFAFDNGVGGVYYLGPGMTHAVMWKDDKADDHQIPVPFEDDSGAKFIRGGFAFFSNGPDTRTGLGQSEPDSKNSAQAYEDDVRSWK